MIAIEYKLSLFHQFNRDAFEALGSNVTGRFKSLQHKKKRNKFVNFSSFLKFRLYTKLISSIFFIKMELEKVEEKVEKFQTADYYFLGK